MECPEARLEIEKLEGLRHTDDCQLPGPVAEHLRECPACTSYLQHSREFELMLFSKFKDVKMPVIPHTLGRVRRRRRSTLLRSSLIAVPFACAAMLMLFVSVFRSSDVTRDIMRRFAEGTLGLATVHAETPEKVMQTFNERTGLSAALPAEVAASEVASARLLRIEGNAVGAFVCRAGNREFTFFVFSADNASEWKCCCEERCVCLSTSECRTTRWVKGDIGYMALEQNHRSGEGR